jgi:hypothetical protein
MGSAYSTYGKEEECTKDIDDNAKRKGTNKLIYTWEEG